MEWTLNSLNSNLKHCTIKLTSEVPPFMFFIVQVLIFFEGYPINANYKPLQPYRFATCYKNCKYTIITPEYDRIFFNTDAVFRNLLFDRYINIQGV
jgi:hypothetical protein